MVTSFKISEILEERVKSLLSGTETVSQFAHRATEEKVNRMEVRNRVARMELYKKDLINLEPFIIEVLRNNGLIEDMEELK